MKLDIETVLRAKEIDPEVATSDYPDLVQDTQRILVDARDLLDPRVLYKTYRIENVRHGRLILTERRSMKGDLLLNHLASAQEVVVLLCTIGNRLENRVQSLFDKEPLQTFILDAVGTVAVEALRNNVVRHFEELAHTKGYGVSIPLSPGMEGWSLKRVESL